MIGLITSSRGLITSDRFKTIPANLPIGESLLSFKFAMNMCVSYDNKIMFVNLIHLIKLVGSL